MLETLGGIGWVTRFLVNIHKREGEIRVWMWGLLPSSTMTVETYWKKCLKGI